LRLSACDRGDIAELCFASAQLYLKKAFSKLGNGQERTVKWASV